eukprot:6927341-Heterocapsa_arctica.AAC.1
MVMTRMCGFEHAPLLGAWQAGAARERDVPGLGTKRARGLRRVRFRTLPARPLNHAGSMENGT